MHLSNNAAGLTNVAMICGLFIVSQAPWQIAQAASGSVTGYVSCSGDAVGITIDIDGEIDAATVESVSKLFDEFREQRKKVDSGVTCEAVPQNPPDLSAYGNHFGINSRGGSVPAAMAIGRILRREGAWIGVNDVCFSARVFILAGAVDRQIGKSDQVYSNATPGSFLQTIFRQPPRWRRP